MTVRELITHFSKSWAHLDQTGVARLTMNLQPRSVLPDRFTAHVVCLSPVRH